MYAVFSQIPFSRASVNAGIQLRAASMKLTPGNFVFVFLLIVGAVVVGGIALIIGLMLLLTLFGNLAYLPMVASLAVGSPLSPGAALMAGAVLAAVIFAGICFFPSPTERVIKSIAVAIPLIIVVGFVIFMVGGTIVFVLREWIGINVPIWAIIPIGAAPFIRLIDWPSSKSK